MDTLIISTGTTSIDRVVATRKRLLVPALATTVRDAQMVLAPCHDRISTPEVRPEVFVGGGFMGVMDDGQPAWSLGTGVGTGSYAAEVKRGHTAAFHNSINFSTRLGPSCSPPV